MDDGWDRFFRAIYLEALYQSKGGDAGSISRYDFLEAIEAALTRSIDPWN